MLCVTIGRLSLFCLYPCITRGIGKSPKGLITLPSMLDFVSLFYFYLGLSPVDNMMNLDSPYFMSQFVNGSEKKISRDSLSFIFLLFLRRHWISICWKIRYKERPQFFSQTDIISNSNRQFSTNFRVCRNCATSLIFNYWLPWELNCFNNVTWIATSVFTFSHLNIQIFGMNYVSQIFLQVFLTISYQEIRKLSVLSSVNVLWYILDMMKWKQLFKYLCFQCHVCQPFLLSLFLYVPVM